MLTARGDDIDRIVGLEMGADDYLSKPCNPREAGRTDSSNPTPATPPLQIRAWTQCLKWRILNCSPLHAKHYCQNRDLGLTSTGVNLLKKCWSTGEVINKKQLTEAVLERKLTQYDRSIDMHISNIRRKLGPYSDGEPRIQSVQLLAISSYLPDKP